MNLINQKSGFLFATLAVITAVVLSTLLAGTIANAQEEIAPSSETSTSTPSTEEGPSTSPEVSPPCCETATSTSPEEASAPLPLPTWTAPLNLSNTQRASLLPKTVIDTQGDKYVFWIERDTFTISNFAIFFKKHEVATNNWVNTSIVTQSPNLPIWNFDIAIDGQNSIHLVYSNGWQTFYLKYQNGTWSVPQIITERGTNASIAIDSNNNPHVIYDYHTYPDEGVYYIKYDGNTWSATTKLFSGAAAVYGSKAIRIDGQNNIHVSWYNWSQIFYSRYNGSNWSEPRALTSPIATYWSVIDARDGQVAIAYTQGGNDCVNQEIYILTSQDNGNNWSNPIRASESPQVGSRWPSITIDNTKTINVAWSECPTISNGVLYRFYRNGQWSEIQDVSNSIPSTDAYITSHDDKLYALWSSYPDGEIHYASTQIVNQEPLLPESPILWQWFVPTEATMGENYYITLRINNPTDVPQQITFSLNQAIATTSREFQWEAGNSTVMKLDGESYQVGDTVERVLAGNETRDFIFTINNKWNWIEPWDASRLILAGGKTLNTFLGDPTKSGDILLFNEVGDIVNLYRNQIDSITYIYVGIVNSNVVEATITVEVPLWKKAALVESIAINFAGAKPLTYIGGWTKNILIAGLGGIEIFFSNLAYTHAEDPQPDYSTPAVVTPIPIPQECISTRETQSKDLIDLYSLLLGTRKALTESYIKFDAAEDVNDLEAMLIHSSLIHKYTDSINVISQTLAEQLKEILGSIPNLTNAEIEEIQQIIMTRGLPQSTGCVLRSLGYSETEISEIGNAITSPTTFFFTHLEAPQFMISRANLLHEMSKIIEPPTNSQEIILDIDPDVINKKSKGRWITAYLELASGRASEIDCSSIMLLGKIPAENCPGTIGDYNHDSNPDIALKFSREMTTLSLNDGNNVVWLVGRLSDGTIVGGVDFVRKN